MAWYNTDWPYRKKITIDGSKVISGPHTDFPVMIDLTDAHILKNMQAFGRDIVITDSDETTKLAHEIVRADPILAFDGMPQPLITCTDYKNDRSYVTWIDSSGNAKIGQYNHSTDTWTTFTLKTGVTVDNHNVPAVLVRSDGKILVVYVTGLLDGSLFSRISNNADDIASWGSEANIASIDSNGYAYPKLIELSGESNKIYFIYRITSGSDRIERFVTSTDGGATWSAVLTASGKIYTPELGLIRLKSERTKSTS